MADETPYPEHEKLKAISHLSQVIGEFLDWLVDGGLDEALEDSDYGSVELAFREQTRRYGRSSDLTPLNLPVRRLLAAYFDIDQDQIEAEKRAMLERLREEQDDD